MTMTMTTKLFMYVALVLAASYLSCSAPDEASEPDDSVLPGDFPDDPAAFSRTVLTPDPPVVPDPYAAIE
jgi:hypothetical protein